MDDLARDPKQAERMKALFAEFLKLHQQMGDKLDVKGVYPELL